MRAAARGNGKRSSARRTCPPESPSCRRLARTRSIAVPETTPSCPRDETARASVQPETPTPSPPWMIFGCSIALLSAPTWHGITPRAARAARAPLQCLETWVRLHHLPPVSYTHLTLPTIYSV